MYLERLFFVLFKYILPCRSSPEGILKIKFLRLSSYSKLAFSHGEHKKVNKIQGFSVSKAVLVVVSCGSKRERESFIFYVIYIK